MESFLWSLCVFTLLFVLSSVHSKLVHLNPKFPLKEPTFSLTSSPLLWPQPSEWVSSPNRFVVPGSISIRTSRKLRYCDILRHNIDKYGIIIRNLIYSSTTASSSTNAEQILKEIYLFVENGNCSKHLYPTFKATEADDESYSIEVQANSGKAILFASNVWGAVRALETVTQMMYVDSAGQKGSHSVSGGCEQLKAVFVNVSRVQDNPRFVYRGLMIDSARHFIPTRTIIKNLDAMAYNKFNTLHWHLNDDQSFPFGSRQFSNFSRFASYSPLHVYRYEDIELINEEARLRGIQVILEVDSPGHGLALGKVFPDLLSLCGPPGMRAQKRLSDRAFDNTLDATRESTYQTLSQLLTELISLFPSKLIHLGMDDVNYDCWNSNPSIREFMSSKRMHNTALLEEYYAKRLIGIVNHLGRTQIVWQDPLDNGVKFPKGTIIQVWKDAKLLSEFGQWQEYMSSVVQKNYSVILSSCWFLSFIRYGQDWRDMYNCDPFDIKATEEQKQEFILGGEACLWGEYVDGSNFMSRLW